MSSPASKRRIIACGRNLYLSPRAGRGWVRGPLSGSEPVERAPHPDPLHSPSKTGVNALMASGEREQKQRGMGDCPQFLR